jgi:hypothetical protein
MRRGWGDGKCIRSFGSSVRRQQTAHNLARCEDNDKLAFKLSVDVDWIYLAQGINCLLLGSCNHSVQSSDSIKGEYMSILSIS